VREFLGWRRRDEKRRGFGGFEDFMEMKDDLGVVFDAIYDDLIGSLDFIVNK
jgi:hypothetical protein